MLDSLSVTNYRNLKELKINSLERVNLITGKNNTGKSAILEAISIYATKGDLAQIYELLGNRGEDFRNAEINKNATTVNVKALSSLFANRVVGFEPEDRISIGVIEKTLFGLGVSWEKSISLRFVKYIDEMHTDNQGTVTTRKKLLEKASDATINFKVGLQTRVGDKGQVIPLDDERPYKFNYGRMADSENLQFIKTRSLDKEIDGKLWDNITLTEKEQFVIDALKIIEPLTERIAFIEEDSRVRAAVIKLSGIPNVLPLRSMGDGINRILTIILALVNAENGFLLIDEFENGLHYTVQAQLWKVIFSLSQRLDVQVFVTTHSEDCISGFEDILNKYDSNFNGKLIRLDNVNGTIKEVEFNAQELKIATDLNIETR